MQPAIAEGEHAPTDDVASDDAHAEHQDHRGQKAETGNRPPENTLVYRRKAVVDPAPERVKDPRGGDCRNCDEEPGDQPDLEPRLHHYSEYDMRHRKPQTRGRALVTGGAVRLGRAIAVGLADAGFDVVIGYHRSAAAARATVRDLRGRGVRALAVRADLREPAAG